MVEQSRVGSGMGNVSGRDGGDIGRRMEDVGESVQEKARRGIESAGEYLQQHGLGDVTGELSNVVKRHPLQSLSIGIGVGFLLGSALARAR